MQAGAGDGCTHEAGRGLDVGCSGGSVKSQSTVRETSARRQAAQAPRQNEDRFRALVMATSDVIYRMSADWSEMRELTGAANTRAAGRDWLEKYVPLDERPKVMAAAREAIRTLSVFQLEHRVLRGDGTVGWTLSRAVPILAADGAIVEWFGAATDITARRRVEEEVEDLYQNAPCGYYSINADGLIVRMNDTLLAWLGYPRARVVGRLRIAQLMSAESLKAYRASFERLQADGGIVHAEREFIRENGTILPVLLNATSLRDAQNRFLRTRSIVIDVTHKKAIEQERLEHAQRFAQLSRELVAVQEEERRRLARELHDRTSPNLVAVAFNLQVIAKKLPPDVARDIRSRLVDTNALLDNTIANIRDVTADLHPSALDHAGLLAALEEYGRQFMHRTGITVQVTGRCGDPGIGPDRQSALFRIAQEALTNCAKHARARVIKVTLESGRDGVCMEIADDGAGFDAALLKEHGESSGLGLLTMRERAEFAGGSFSFVSQPGKGTRVQVRMEAGA
jgi:PAS domain S-box-containing protein